MENTRIVGVSDFYRLAVLDALKIKPVSTRRSSRYFEYFYTKDIEKIISDYERGDLSLPVRDFVSALQRVKTRIFESERANTNYQQAG